MLQRNCPSCDHLLDLSNINLKEGVALCPSCGTLTRLSKLMNLPGDDADVESGDWSNTTNDLWRQTPAGCSVRGWHENITVKATTRSFLTAIGLAFFGLFWNAIVSVFLVIALGGLIGSLAGSLPSWFPSQGGKKSSGMPLGMAIFLLIFLIPFVAVGASLIYGVLIALFGSVILCVNQGKAKISTGIGPLRWWRRFDVNTVTKVSLGEHKVKSNNNRNNKPTRSVHIEADRLIRTGNSLSETRMKWFGSVATLLLMGPQLAEVDELLAADSSDSKPSSRARR